MLRDNHTGSSAVPPSPLNWFALSVRPRHEKAAARGLETRGIETFLPLTQRRHQYANRTREFDLPLFPGYLFCRFNEVRRVSVLSTPGVLQVVGAGMVPTPVSDGEIATLQTAIRERVRLEPHPFLSAGQTVKIVDGPLAGIEGIVMSLKSPLRVVVTITLLQRSVLLEIDPDSVDVEKHLYVAQ